MADNEYKSSKIGIIGAGTIGIGIARLASANGHRVLLYDSYPDQLGDAKHRLRKGLQKQVTEGYIGQQQVNELIDRIRFSDDLTKFGKCNFVIEVVTEDVEIKKDALKRAEAIIPRNCLLATTTSTLSIADLSSVLKRPGRFAGLRFFTSCVPRTACRGYPGPAHSMKKRLIKLWIC
ncbi:MAG: 3-hydroxyacyl-CoA dehydrogenase NAD-binding domain-containing protein [Balneolaceae bacterium]|nr:3-hydroxyacyl-CoA dehydrogenase NAD-binding domain-containing protein [Balneolaceae bacterium]